MNHPRRPTGRQIRRRRLVAYDEGFAGYLRQGGADLSAHSWHGGHDDGYWNAHCRLSYLYGH